MEEESWFTNHFCVKIYQMIPSELAQRIEEYDRKERKLIFDEHEKHDGRTTEQILADVSDMTRQEHLSILRESNGTQVCQEPS